MGLGVLCFLGRYLGLDFLVGYNWVGLYYRIYNGNYKGI